MDDAGESVDRRQGFRRQEDRDVLIEVRTEVRQLIARMDRQFPEVYRTVGDVRADHAANLAQLRADVDLLKLSAAQHAGALLVGRWAVATVIGASASTAAIVSLVLKLAGS